MKKNKLRPVQQIVFDEIMKAIDSGVVPWRSQFTSCLPYNGVSKKEYSGMNLILLALRPFPSGAAFLAARAGILQPQIDNIASYLAGWSRKLKHDPKALFTAATAAQRAFDFITQTK